MTDESLHGYQHPVVMYRVLHASNEVLVPDKTVARRPRPVSTLVLRARLPEAVRAHVMLKRVSDIVGVAAIKAQQDVKQHIGKYCRQN